MALIIRDELEILDFEKIPEFKKIGSFWWKIGEFKYFKTKRNAKLRKSNNKIFYCR